MKRSYRIFDADWYSQKVEENIRYKNGEADMKLAVLAKELLGLYFQNPIKDVIGSGIPFVIPLSNPSNGDKLGVYFKGFIDLVEKDDIIAEFKTSKQAMNQRDVDSHLQLTVYSFFYECLPSSLR